MGQICLQDFEANEAFGSIWLSSFCSVPKHISVTATSSTPDKKEPATGCAAIPYI